jgi:hypothetical protein
MKTIFKTYIRDSRKHRSGKPQIHLLAIKDNHIIGQLRKTQISLEEAMDFCSRDFRVKEVVDKCDPILL